MPSLFEPCGLGQLIAMRYGSIPVVRATGGLADTVRAGVTGFTFLNYHADDFWNTVLDPQRRTVIRVHLDEGEAKLHHTLFGGPPEGRRTWMADIASRVDTSALDLD